MLLPGGLFLAYKGHVTPKPLLPRIPGPQLNPLLMYKSKRYKNTSFSPFEADLRSSGPSSP